MFDVLKSITWGLLRRFFARSPVEVDIVALRHQVAVLQRQSRHRPKLTRWDRLLFAAFITSSLMFCDQSRSCGLKRWCDGTGQGFAFSGDISPAAKEDGHAFQRRCGR